MLFSTSVIPKHCVRLDCGSISIKRTFFPFRAIPAPIFSVDVVFPTPPLWLLTAITFFIFIMLLVLLVLLVLQILQMLLISFNGCRCIYTELINICLFWGLS